MTVFQCGIGEDAVEEEKRCGGKDKVVELPPDGPADAGAQQGRYKNQEQQVERTGAGQVEFGLQRRVDGKKNVEEPESRRAEKEQNCRMSEGEEDGAIRGPLMEEENINVPVRPVSHRAVAQRDQQPDEEVGGGCSDGAEPEIRAEI